MKRREEEIAAEREEEEKEARARQLLEDPIEDEEGAPKTCLEAMQCTGSEERDFCISLISQWLAPKWLVASKAGAIEACSIIPVSSVSGLVSFYRMQTQRKQSE